MSIYIKKSDYYLVYCDKQRQFYAEAEFYNTITERRQIRVLADMYNNTLYLGANKLTATKLLNEFNKL